MEGHRRARRRLALFITIGAWHFVSEAANPTVTYADPTGVFTDISEADLLQSTGITCDVDAYAAPYSHPTSSEDIDKSHVSIHRYVLVGAKSFKASRKFAVVAIGEHNLVFNVTSSTSVARWGGGGAYWYYQSGYAFGFTPFPTVSLEWVDRDPAGCENKLSWHLDNSLGGWSAGCTRGLWQDRWYKIVKYCNPDHLRQRSRDRLEVFHTKVLSPGYTKPQQPQQLHQPQQPQQWQHMQPTDMTLQPSHPPPPPVRIGAVLSLDPHRKYSQMGKTLKRAYLLFVDFVNSVRGGVFINGTSHPLELTMVEDRSEKDVAQTATQYLVEEEGIRLLLGPYGSRIANESAAVAHNAGAVMILSATTADYVYRDRPKIFGIATVASEQFATVVAELGRQGARTIAILQEDSYPSAACDAVSTLASQHGIQVILTLTLDPYDYHGDVNQTFATLASSHPDVVLACTYTELCHWLFQEAQSRHLDASAFVFTTCVSSSEWLSNFGDAGRFVIGITPWLPNFGLISEVSHWTSEEFAAQYARAYGLEPEYQAAAGWAAMETFVHAIEMAGTLEPAKVAHVLQNIDIMTLYGRVAFNSDGQNTNDWKVIQYVAGNNTAQLVGPVVATAKPLVYPRPGWDTQACFLYANAASKKCTVGLNASGYCGRCSDLQESEVYFAVWHAEAWNGIAAGCKCQLGVCQPGHILAAGSCEVCPAGRYAHGQGLCVSCKLGSYADTAASRSCKQCPAGKFANMSGSTACQLCHVGHTSDAGSRNCVRCMRGASASEPGMSQCVQCYPGTYTEEERTQHCKTCAPGKSSVWGGYTCSDCPVGKFQSRAGMSVCFECPLGATCDLNGTVLPSTNDGWWRLHFSPAADDQWLPCSSKDLCTADESCRSGHTGVLCEVCLPGYFKDHRLIHCEKCQAWFFHAFMAMIFGSLVMVLIYISTAMSVEATGKASAITDALLKLLFNYITSVSVTAGVFKVIFMDSMKRHLYETGNIQDGFPLMLNSVLLRFSFTEFYSWFVPAECVFQPNARAYDQEWADALAVANTSSTLTWEDALASMHHTEILPGLQGMDRTFQPPLHLALAQQRLEDYHWTSAFRQQLFWFFVPVIVLVMVTASGFLIVLLFLCLRRRRNRKVIEFLDQIVASGFRAAAQGHSREDCYYFLEVAERRLLGLYPVIRYARLWQSSTLMVIRHYIEDSEPLMIVSLFFLYPTMVERCLQPLRCRFPFGDIGDNLKGNNFMTTSPDLRCYQLDDALFWLSILGMMIYTVGVPAFGAWKLYTNRFNLSRHFNQTWGFLTNGYEISMRHWECLLLFRKSVTLLLVSISMPEGLRILLLVLNSATFTLVHIWYSPYDNRFNELLDRVETRHLIVWVLFLIGILWTYLESRRTVDVFGETSAASDDLCVYIVSITIAVLHVWFLYMIVRQLIRHGLASYAEQIVKQREKEELVTSEIRDIEGVNSMRSRRSGRSRRRSERERPVGYTTTSGLIRYVKQLTFREFSYHWRDLLYWTQSCLFGNWANRHYQKYLLRKPYLVGDARDTWFMLMGVKSYENAQRPGPIGRLSVTKMPGSAKNANEKQRRYLVKIIEETVEYLVVNQNFSTFSATLLEFILRVGFAFNEEGGLRTVAQKQRAKCLSQQLEVSTEARPFARCDRSSSSLAAVSEDSRTESGRLGTQQQVSFAPAQDSAESATMAVVRRQESGRPGVQPRVSFAPAQDSAESATFAVAGSSEVLDGLPVALREDIPGTQDHEAARFCRHLSEHRFASFLSGGGSNTSLGPDIVKGVSNSSLRTNLAHAVKGAMRAGSMDFDDEQPQKPVLSRMLSRMTSGTESSESSSWTDLAARGSMVVGVSEEQVRVLVEEMLRPEIFSTGVQLEELQLNLSLLRSVPRERLHFWISSFEATWCENITERVQAAVEDHTSDPSIVKRFQSDESLHWSQAEAHRSRDDLRVAFGQPPSPDTTVHESEGATANTGDHDSVSHKSSDNSGSSVGSAFLSGHQALLRTFTSERLRASEVTTMTHKAQAEIDEWNTLQRLRDLETIRDDLAAEWAHFAGMLLLGHSKNLSGLTGAFAAHKLQCQELVIKTHVRELNAEVAAKRAEYYQALKQALENQALRNKILEKEKRKLRNALDATDEAKEELRGLRQRLAIPAVGAPTSELTATETKVQPVHKGGMRATLQAMREAKQQRQRLAHSQKVRELREFLQAASVGQDLGPSTDGASSADADGTDASLLDLETLQDTSLLDLETVQETSMEESLRKDEDGLDTDPFFKARARGQGRKNARACAVLNCVHRDKISSCM